jgi:formylglycine-generating enzyme required for sulfatase activity
LWKEITHKGSFEVLEAASLHQQPRSSSPSVSKLEPGQSVAATHRVKGMNWLRVRTRGGKAGFVHKSVLRQPFTFEVASYSGRFETTSNVKLLAQPRIGSRQVASLTVREKLTAIGKVRNRNWLKVRRTDGAEGYVPETLLSIPFDWRERVLKPKPYKTVASATLRTEPRSTARLVASLAPSQIITVVAKIEGREWLKVKLKDEREGYVLENLLQRVVARLAARVFKSKENFRDCPTCPMMVAIPTGEFTMGSKDGTRDQRPTRKITFTRMFAIGKFEVTFKEWGTCVSGGGCRSVPSDNGWGRENRPVINVSWDDAQEFARWLTKKTGERYHLLSEAQWEYAARAGSQTKYAWADTIGDNRANCKGCGSQWDGKSTGTVGSFKPNAFGLHDMHGNVWEWTEDCWHRNYRRAPKDGRAWTTGSCKQSVLRGGSFREGAEFSSSTRRARYPSAPRDNFGFRIARIIN